MKIPKKIVNAVRWVKNCINREIKKQKVNRAIKNSPDVIRSKKRRTIKHENGGRPHSYKKEKNLHNTSTVSPLALFRW